MPHPHRRVAVVAAALLCSLAASPAPKGAPPFTYTIARARTLPAGRTVTVEGIVTVPSGVMDAEFAVQDATGGIYVADSTGYWSPGARMRVTGRLADIHGLMTIAPL